MSDVLTLTARDVAVLAAAYLLGSIPFSYLVARRRGVDVRRVGSGNVGATNVMRSVGRAAGFVAFALDFAKGSLATALAIRVSGGALVPSLAAAVAVLAHMHPVWLRFKGGKGVATGAGAFLPLAVWPTVAALVLFGVVLAVSRYVSVASILATSALALFTRLWGLPLPVTVAAVFCAALIVWKHRANVRRLAAGTENRMGAPRAPGPP